MFTLAKLPCRKCGAALASPLLAAGASAAGGIGASMIQGSYSSANVDKQLAAQSQENAINRDWQTSEAEKNRSFQSSMVNQQNQFQQGLQAQQQRYNLQSMAKQAHYDSPVYQRQQLENAGLNPQVYFGQQSSFGGSSAVAGGSPSASSAPSGSMPGSVAGLSPVGYQPPNLNIGQIVKDFADARKTMSETQSIDLMRDPLYKEVVSRVKNQDLVNEFQELNNYVFSRIKDTKVQRAFVDLSKSMAELTLNEDQHKLNELEAGYKQALTRLQDSLSSLHSSEAMLVGLKIKTFDQAFQSEMATAQSQRAANYASAEESRQRARYQRFDNDMRDRFSVELVDNYLQDLKAKNYISIAQYNEALQRARRISQIEKHNERFKDVDAFLTWLKGFLPFMDSTSSLIK